MNSTRKSSKSPRAQSPRATPSYEEQLAELGLVAANATNLDFDLTQSADCDPDGYVQSISEPRPAYDAIVSKVIEDNASPWDPPGGDYTIGIVASDRKTIYRVIRVGGFVELMYHVDPLVSAGFENILAELQHRLWDAVLVPTWETVARHAGVDQVAVIRESAEVSAQIEAQDLSVPLAHEDLATAEDQLLVLSTTEREQVVLARVGQGRFRSDLVIEFGGRCGLTGFAFEPVLRASHIKPWRDSTNVDRLDASNGLLLRADIDALFDAGYISFQASGQLLRTEALPDSALRSLANMSSFEELRLPESLLTIKRLAFLEHHRTQVFQG